MFIHLRVSCLNAHLCKISSTGGNHADSHLITLSILFNIARLNTWSQIHYWIGAHNTVTVFIQSERVACICAHSTTAVLH